MIELLLQAERALEMGRVDAAETLYRQVADADPRNSIAVVGLARIALERGNEVGALELAQRALEIDPENAAAGRMVARLTEVLSYRAVAAADDALAVATGDDLRAVPVVRDEPWSASTIIPGPVIEPAPPAAIEPPPAAIEPPPRRRSWLDRLLRRNR
jgi:hypothetical protein